MSRPRARYERTRLRTRRQMHAAITVGACEPAPDPEKIAAKITEAVALVRACDFTTVPADADLPIWHPESLSKPLDPDDEDVFTAYCIEYANGSQS